MDCISLGADIGGKDAFLATQNDLLAFRKKLIAACSGNYSGAVGEIAFVLRIDGNVQSWKKLGVENIVFKKNNKRVELDIFVTEEIWKNEDVFYNYVAKEVIKGLNLIAKKAEKKRILFDFEGWFADINSAISNNIDAASHK